MNTLEPDQPIMNTSPKENLRQALRFVEAGHSLMEAETLFGFSRRDLEHHLIQAKTRQTLIRQHLQSRPRLTSVLRYPERGPWGISNYFGNCPGYLVVDLLDYLKPKSLFDPMEGSGTAGDVCFDFEVDYCGGDLQLGFDLLSSPLPNRDFELIFWHPPYWPGHQYSTHPNDLSSAKNIKQFLLALHAAFTRLIDCLAPMGHLALLIGDGRKQGKFYPIHNEIIQWNLLRLEVVLIKEGDHQRRAQFFRYGPTPFIPTLHEYLLIFQKENT